MLLCVFFVPDTWCIFMVSDSFRFQVVSGFRWFQMVSVGNKEEKIRFGAEEIAVIVMAYLNNSFVNIDNPFMNSFVNSMALL